MNLADDLRRHRAQYYSQNGEDGALERLLEIVGTTNRYCVEFGVGDGQECNTRLLRERGWSGLMMDYAAHDPAIGLYREFITADNVTSLFHRYDVPASFDVLSIDVDGNDYWIWKAVAASYRPRIVIIEYNCAVPAGVAVTMPYAADFRWANQPNIGPSLLAVHKLARSLGYALVYADPPNAFVALRSILPAGHRDLSVRALSATTWREDWRRRREWNAGLRQLPWVYV